MGMDLEIIGRHALLFDDDASAGFVNSGEALVEWHSLKIDRYDVRHLLSSPPPSRRRKNQTFLQLDDPSLQSQLDYQRYLDLILQPDQPEIEEDEKPLYTGGYRAVGFSYGNSEDSADQNSSAALESSVFLPPFPIPEDVKSLPPTEKVHQIIARTATFVSKHGGQSEIILRVKQGDNPTFGFLMPGHHLHAYFRFLVNHPDLLHSEGPQDEGKKDGGEHKHGEGIGGALSLLGSIYGSVEEEDNEDIKETDESSSLDNVGVVDHTVSSSLKKTDKKDESRSGLILSNKEKVISVKKNPLVKASKSGCPKGPKKEDKSGSLSAAAGKLNSSANELVSKVEPLVLEPPHELKRLIDKLVEFIVRNGKQFEATLIEQDNNDGWFPFLLPSNQYHSYYLQVLQAAQELKYNGTMSGSGKANNLSSLPSTAGFIRLESDRKEKIKMVIGKSKKELEESESKATQCASRTSVDAATAAAILQAATRGIKNPNMQMIPDTPLGANSHANGRGGDQATCLGNSPDSQLSNAVGKSDQTEAPLPEEQKLKAERLKRAKLFVATLKSRTVPNKPGASRSSSMEPVHSGVVVDLESKEKEASLASPAIDPTASTEKPDINYFDEHIAPFSKRKFRSRSGKSEDSEGGDEDRVSRSKYGSKSRRYDEDMEREDAIEREEQKHHKRSHHSRSSREIKDEGVSNEEERDHKSHWSYDSREKDNEYGDMNQKRSRRKHRSHHSPHETLKKRHSSKQHSEEEDDPDSKERHHKDSRRKHRSHRSSIHRRDKKRHRNEHSSRERHHRKHHGSSDDEDPSESISDKHKKGIHGAELEEGEISSRNLRQFKDIATGHVSRETSVDLASSHQRASSQPIEASAEVPNDLRAKVRAMLMATRLS